MRTRSTANVSQELMWINRLKAWRPGLRLLVKDDDGSEDPLWASVASISDDYRSFVVEWSHNGQRGRISVTDIDAFLTEDEA